MKKIKVGYLYDSYPYKRNIVDIIDNVDYEKVTDLYKIGSIGLKVLAKLGLLRRKELLEYLNYSFNDFNMSKVDILHFFNNVSYGSTPWISTFETFIPRYQILMNHQENGITKNSKVDKALLAIASDSCKKIIALSECTLNFQKELLKVYPQYKDIIENKLCVIHPPQKLYINDFKEKNLDINDEVSFIFVGKDFFRKGGLEILKVFRKLRNIQKIPVKLTLISSLSINDYATRSGEDEYKLAMKIIKNNPTWIRYYDRLENEEVLKLMGKHHVGLLPTWADTYGYSLLEMQSMGCPVISTNVRALPEINDDDKGWIINVPKNYLGEALYSTSELREYLSESIQNQLEKIVLEIFKNKAVIIEKSQNSIKNIHNNHSPKNYAMKLFDIYQSVLF